MLDTDTKRRIDTARDIFNNAYPDGAEHALDAIYAMTQAEDDPLHRAVAKSPQNDGDNLSHGDSLRSQKNRRCAAGAGAGRDTFEVLNEMAKLLVLSLIPGTAVDPAKGAAGFK